MTLREYIRRARIDLGISIHGLGHTLSLAHTNIAQWESGVRPVPRKHLPALINALWLDELYVEELWADAARESPRVDVSDLLPDERARVIAFVAELRASRAA